MLEVWFGVALGLLLASNIALWLKLHVWGMVANIGGAWAQKRFGQVAQMIPDIVPQSEEP